MKPWNFVPLGRSGYVTTPNDDGNFLTWDFEGWDEFNQSPSHRTQNLYLDLLTVDDPVYLPRNWIVA